MKKAVVSNPPFPKNYSNEFICFEEGEGVRITDSAGKKYLDFGAGIAVNALGHGNTRLAEVARDQMLKVIHVSNLYTTGPALELAEKLVGSGPFAAVHFGNSGAEANEAALKYARLYTHKTRGEGNHRVMAFEGGFHGRTLGALSCTFSAKYQDPFKPLLPGFEVAKFNDIEAVEKRLDGSFAAVIVEIVQGEGGLSHIEKDFAAALNRLCKKHDIILIVDEVQTGLTRTGSLYAHTAVGLEPDIMTLSKPLAGGLPLSATLIPDRINKLLVVGEHGTTFGGGPVTTAVALEVWNALSKKDFIEQVAKKGQLLKASLEDLKKKHSCVDEVRGVGLLQGLVVSKVEVKDVLKETTEAGLLLLSSGANVIRIAPPLVISDEELGEGIKLLDGALQKLGGG